MPFRGISGLKLGFAHFSSTKEPGNIILLVIKERLNIMFCHIRFKACRKCGGDISLEEDQYGRYFVCIQCGAEWNESNMASRSLEITRLSTTPLMEKHAVMT
jgi:hypothetical protein